MSKSIVIVESPAKARTLKKYLGKDFTVMASVGHVRDLPKSTLGIDLEKNFEPQYVVIKDKKKILSEIKKAARNADHIYLASDPDREGEAIAWHIAEELDGKKTKIYRVLFHEITQRSVQNALAHPEQVNLHKVQAQQARRVLDRIVGYKISPLLWEKVRRGLSAGRVQSVTVRLIAERGEVIQAFVQEEFWTIAAQLTGSSGPPFTAKLHSVKGKPAKIPSEEKALEVVQALEGTRFEVQKIEKKGKKRNPLPPFTTSKLEQEAARKIQFTPKKTMMIAQQLYEGIDLGEEGPVGLITYMRTDSTRVGPDAQQEIRQYVQARYGPDYVPEKVNIFKNRKNIQDAHEAIRPSAVSREPEAIRSSLHKDQYLLYKLIWNRTVASQMNPALLDVTRVDIQAGTYLFRETATVMRFPGFTTVYAGEQTDPGAKDEAAQEKTLPPLQEGQALQVVDLTKKQHFTQPPPHYNEALLIKEMEELGIGRPSTYHTIISTIQDRKYVEKVEKHFEITELGSVVNELLVHHFPDVLNVEFTAKLEEELDEIEEGSKEWVHAVQDFYGIFQQRLEKAQIEMKDLKREEIPTAIVCDRCEKPMVIRWGKNGQFLACKGYPDCRNTKEFVRDQSGEVSVVQKEVEAQGECERCGHAMVVKHGRFGKFLACSKYPDCKFTKAIGTGVACPQPDCDGELGEKRTRKGKVFFACNRYPKCDHALWDRPVPRACPQCSSPFLIKHQSRKGRQALIKCPQESCTFQEDSG